MGARLKQALELRGRTPASLIAALGVSKGAVYNILNDLTRAEKVRAATVAAICGELQIDREWLLRGVGAMDLAPQAPARSVREPPPETGYMRRILAWNTPADLPPDQFTFLPHLDALLSAGNGGPLADAIEKTDKSTPFRSDYVRRRGWSEDTHFTMRCKGDSMEPTIQDGAPVVIDTSDAGRRVQSGRVYAIAVDGELLLKRLDRLPNGLLRVRSDNPAPMYAPYEFAEAAIDVIGRAVWTPTEL